jgi:hypothetical protein
MSADLVSMFRCKHCRVRMFEHDCHGHLRRHGLGVPSSDVLTHFVRGAKNMFPRPGARGEGLYQVHQRRKKAARPKADAAEDELAV